VNRDGADMILDQKQLDHIKAIYSHMNEFALRKAVENLLDTVVSYQTEMTNARGDRAHFERERDCWRERALSKGEKS
jgi:hypothetical protein